MKIIKSLLQKSQYFYIKNSSGQLGSCALISDAGIIAIFPKNNAKNPIIVMVIQISFFNISTPLLKIIKK